MKQRLFEDDQVFDVQRQMSGMGSETLNKGPITIAGPLDQKSDGDTKENKFFPIDSIEQTVAGIFIELSNTQGLLEIAKSNPVLNKEHIEALENKLKGITEILVDFDELLFKISNG